MLKNSDAVFFHFILIAQHYSNFFRIMLFQNLEVELRDVLLLSVGLCASVVSLGQVEAHFLRVLVVEFLNKRHRPVAQRLTDRVEKYEDQVRQGSEPQNRIIDVEVVLHVAINQAWRVHKSN
jgi:hypothetical protein